MFGIKRVYEPMNTMRNGDIVIGKFPIGKKGKGWFIPKKYAFLQHILKYF
jgi:hypothetical protein